MNAEEQRRPWDIQKSKNDQGESSVGSFAGRPLGTPAGPPPGVPAGPPPGTDGVAGVLNMPAFARHYAQVIMSHRFSNLALWYIDIRNFRSINPNYGFIKGNLVLKTLADNIKKLLSHDLPVARLGADRFVPLTEGLTYEQATERFNSLIEKTNQDITAVGINHQVILAAGIYYLRPEDLNNPSYQKPMDYVSIAHRHAREEPQSKVIQFTDHDLELDIRRITIEQSLDDALMEGQIEVWYQPQIDYTYGEVIGAEALARWNHPTLGWISPAEFIPVLENCGRVHDLDLFVWEEACRSASQWRNMADGKPVPISVNVSRTEMFVPGLMDHFLSLQEKYNLPKGSLHLEVTESAFAEEADRLYSVIEKMRSNSMLVEMDDFGSGLSSLNMLKDIPVDVVKLDMGFMRSAMNEDRGGVVLGSIIRMMQGLDTPIIAEGVETIEQAEMLKNMGCHLMQGYHFSRPMPLDEFEGFIATNRAVDTTVRREHTDSHLEELTSIDSNSSYLFNHAIGGMIYFFAADGVSESILVNDEFYKECGLDRKAFGNARINPIVEVAPESRATLWRAAAEAREYGSAMCSAEVRLTNRWIDCVMRFVGPSKRGDIYSLNIIRSRKKGSSLDRAMQATEDINWDLDLLNKIVPNGFIKCRVNESLTISYISPELIPFSGLSGSEFMRRFHNSLIEAVDMEDRHDLQEAINENKSTGKSFNCEVSLLYGYGNQTREACIVGHVEKDDQQKSWLYAMVLMVGDPTNEDEAEQGRLDVIRFDYEFETDTLKLFAPVTDGERHITEFPSWRKRLEDMPDYISKASAAKVLSIMNDVRHHPCPGFSDIKCNLRGSEGLRWFHVNYTCDADQNGNTTVMHGYAQDANDQMGSARWWRRQAEIDQLTGLLNRNAVEQEMNLSMRTQGSGMMFMIDLDGFKRINDELGHLAGDALLRDVARALSANFRDSDILGRYGGDEFVAFVPISGDFAQNIARKRSQCIIESISKIEAGDGTHAACSVGVAISHNRAATFYDLLEVADEAMYASKEAGKGCYTIRHAESEQQPKI